KESKKGSKNPLVEKRYGKHIIYKLDNDGFGVLSDRFFVYAKKEADIKNTLDVLNGKKKNSGSSDLMANLKKMPKRAFLVAAAADISELGKEAPGKMLSNAGVATFMAMENNKNLALRALLNTGSADDARNIENVAKGLMSLANMKIEGEFKQYLELLNGIDFRSEGAVLNVGFEYPIEKLVKMLKEAKSCKHKHGSKHKHDHEDHDHEKEA
ncbi:MAG: hypothetical protein GY765_15125, partial [bacterium]|nr:hypothetical protein [bacterium]